MKGNCIRAKLRSQRGASILFALFFFIVCAVIGSIVLTAASVAAGRMSLVREMDQRYWAVNSAAELLEQELSRPDAVVTVKTVTKEKKQITSRLTLKTNANGKKYWAEGERSAPTTVEEAARHLPEGTETGNEVMVLLKDVASWARGSQTDSAELTVKYGPETNSFLNTKADIGVDQNYNMTIVLRDTIGTNEDRRYYLTMVCPAHVDRKEKVAEETISVTVSGNGDTRTRTRTELRQVTTTTVETITWSVASTMKGRGAAS